MDRFEAIVAVCGIIFGTTSVVGVAWAVAYGAVKYRKAAAPVSDAALSRIEQRMERIEQAIDAVAVEVERVSEGQRFTTRLLSEHSGEKLKA